MAQVRTKEFRFPLGTEWAGGRTVVARVEGKHVVHVTPPPEFHGDDPALWSPEDMFVGAAASCLAVTFTGLAQRAGMAVRRLLVDGEGVVGRRDDGRFGFTRLDLRLEVETEPGEEQRALELAEQADLSCLVSVSLDLPVETTIEVRAAAAA